MHDKTQERDGRPNLVGNYRPVAIRSVVAAHAMIPKPRLDITAELPAFAAGFALPADFHNPAED